MFKWTLGPRKSDLGSHYEVLALSSNHNENMLQLIAGHIEEPEVVLRPKESNVIVVKKTDFLSSDLGHH